MRPRLLALLPLASFVVIVEAYYPALVDQLAQQEKPLSERIHRECETCLFAAHPRAMGKVLSTVYRVISTHLIYQERCRRRIAQPWRER